MVVRDGLCASRRYWEPQLQPDSGLDEATALDAFEARLQETLRDQIVADVPVGAFLSGGIDSSLLVSYLAPARREPLDTFTVGFDDSRADESPWARIVAERFGTRHHELRVRLGDGGSALVERVLDQFDQPFGDSSAIPTWLVAQKTREHVKTVISGDGGDELFGGYTMYRTAAELGRLRRWPIAARKGVAVAAWAAALAGRSDTARRLNKALALAGLSASEALCALRSYFDEAGKRRLYRPEQAARVAGLRTSDRFADEIGRQRASAADLPTALAACDLRHRLAGDMLCKVDMMSMSHGLEVRVPLLDERIVELALRLPPSLRLRGRVTKYLLAPRRAPPPARVDRAQAQGRLRDPAALRGRRRSRRPRRRHAGSARAAPRRALRRARAARLRVRLPRRPPARRHVALAARSARVRARRPRALDAPLGRGAMRTLHRIHGGSRLRVLAVANWDFYGDPTPWAVARLEALRRADALVDLLQEDCVTDRRGFLRLWRALDDRLARCDYDVVAPLYGSVLGLLCAAQRRVPCALSLAGSDLNGEPRADGRLGFGALPSRAASHLASVLARGTSVRTRAMRDALLWPPARAGAEVIPSGVDLARFAPLDRAEARRRLRLPPEGRRVVFVGSEARPVKRLELARAAVALLDGVTLDIVDRRPHDEMPLVYAAADALVLTSYREGSPNCVKEALACAIPVVGVDVGDLREVLGGLTNCAVVAAEPVPIAAALGRALADGRGCPEGPAAMAERHSIDAMARRFLRFYERVAARA